MAGAAALGLCNPAFAASDITIAAIATGRLYVGGSTERPHTPVLLDGQFRTESDDRGTFQYELVYHPARCIVSAQIDGKAYEAVVSNCGQQCQSNPPQTVGSTRPAPAHSVKPAPAPRRPGAAAAAEPPDPVTPPGRAGQGAGAANPSTTSAPIRSGTIRSGATGAVGSSAEQRRRRAPTSQPPAPPSRPTTGLNARSQPAPSARAPERSRPRPAQDPNGPDALPED